MTAAATLLPPEPPPQLLDTRGFSKVPHFSGKDEDWADYIFKFDGYATLLGWGDRLEKAATHPSVIENSRLLDESRQVSTNLYAILQLNTSGKALGIVRLVPRGEGMEAWRQLHREYAPDVGGRHAGLLRSILNPKWWLDHEEKPFMELLNAWEAQVIRYNADIIHYTLYIFILLFRAGVSKNCRVIKHHRGYARKAKD